MGTFEEGVLPTLPLPRCAVFHIGATHQCVPTGKTACERGGARI
jgi:hypothetical protein